MTQEVCMLTLVGNVPKESHASCNFPFFSSDSQKSSHSFLISVLFLILLNLFSTWLCIIYFLLDIKQQIIGPSYTTGNKIITLRRPPYNSKMYWYTRPFLTSVFNTSKQKHAHCCQKGPSWSWSYGS